MSSCQVGWRHKHPGLAVGTQEDWWFLHSHSSVGGTGGQEFQADCHGGQDGERLLSCLFQGPEGQNRLYRGFVFFPWNKVSKTSRLSKLQVSGDEKVREVWSRKACSFQGGLLPSC